MNKITIDLPHSLNYHDVASSRDVIPAQGLSPSEAGKRLLKDGPTAISSGQKVGMFSIFVHQFSSLVVGLLAVAAAVAFYFGEWEEGIAIVGVLFLNAAIGFVTEVKAVRSIEAIRKLGTRSVRVLRGGETCTVPAESLVIGRCRIDRCGRRGLRGSPPGGSRRSRRR